MYRSKFPRLYELKDRLPESGDSTSLYFQDFDKTLEISEVARNAFSILESELEVLDGESWKFLRDETTSFLAKRHPERNWQQLFDKLNEAKGYKFLSEIGCSQIRFIPRSKKNGIETPDLEGCSCGGVILCEVKTINISDDEISTRKKFIARSANYELPEPFFEKFDSTLKKAESQLLSYRQGDTSRRIAYFIINFDEPLSLNFDCYRVEYRKQLRAHIAKIQPAKIEIKVHDLLN